jgi:hypothetical protein
MDGWAYLTIGNTGEIEGKIWILVNRFDAFVVIFGFPVLY